MLVDLLFSKLAKGYMLKALLLVVSSFGNAPAIQTQAIDTIRECRVAAEAITRMMAAQASSNFVAGSSMAFRKDEKTGDWVLETNAGGREIARVACVGIHLRPEGWFHGKVLPVQ